MTTKQASPQGLRWFQDARFGMFVHWGLYSLLGRGEWVMFHEKIPVPEYEKLASQFNPERFDAAAWVGLAADAGQKYIVITSRHHDGFSMYDTALSDYKVTNTHFRRDPLRELAEACARRGDIHLGFYNSLLDWHHPAYRFRQESGLAWSDYLGFLHGQIRELCTQYGPVACIWLDGDWPRQDLDEARAHFVPGGSFEYAKLYDLIHTLQPDAVILNNRHNRPLPGEDIQGFEQDLPGQNTASFNTTSVYDLPLEVCLTINNSWGYNAADQEHKSARELLHTLVRAASLGANLLLNVGPTAQGEILPVHTQRLRQVGVWLRANGPAVYATRRGAIPPTPDGSAVSTQRGDTHYVHLLDDLSDALSLAPVPPDLTQATLLHDGSPVKATRQGETLTLTLKPGQRHPLGTVIKLSP